MSKWQFWTLNSAGALCALLIVINLGLAQLDVRLNKSVAEVQGQFNQAQRLQNTAQSLVGRIAEASQKEPALRDLLARHNLRSAQNTERAAAAASPAPTAVIPPSEKEKAGADVSTGPRSASGSTTNTRTGPTP